MQKPQWINANMLKNKIFLITVGVSLLLLLLVVFFNFKDPGRPPGDALAQAISKTRDAKNFRYRVETRTKINNKNNTFSQVEGEKFRPDNLHIKGQVMKTPIEIFQINEKIYSKDNYGGNWVNIDINELNQDGNFINELNPLEDLVFRDLGEVNYKGVAKVRDAKLWEYELRPIIDNQYMEALYSDFVYNIWVHPGKEIISKVVIKAKGKEDENDEFMVTIEFLDYNKVKPINPPV